jgi:phosphatidylserine/phosphatidylglycerophosphate/cardiolipin synthase-like enzyme
MRHRAHVAFVALLLGSISASFGSAADAPVPAQGTLQAAFAPWDDIELLVTDVIGGARKQILVQAYLLTSKQIVTSLIAAHRRGVRVHVMVDAGQLVKTPDAASELAAAGIAVWTENKYQNAHNKIIVVDAGTPAATVVTGSFNFTWTAQHRNAENVLIVRNNPTLAARYASNWEQHKQDATPFQK